MYALCGHIFLSSPVLVWCWFLRDSFGASGFEDEIEEEVLQEGGIEVAEFADDDRDDERFRAGTVVYISGEENNSQVAARAARCA